MRHDINLFASTEVKINSGVSNKIKSSQVLRLIKVNTMATKASISKIWMSPPNEYNKNPTNQPITSTTAKI